MPERVSYNSPPELQTEIGLFPMKPKQRDFETYVHQSIYHEGGFDRATQVVKTTAGGSKAFNVRIRFTGPMSTVPETENHGIRADSPEQAKAIALRICRDRGYKDVSILNVELIPGSDKIIGLPKTGNAVNPDPNMLVGLVLPTAVHRDLDTSQVILPPR